MISVIVPTYNDELYIENCIDSILNQNYDDFEIVIIDDGSTDNTPEILKKYFSNQKIKILYQENKGAGAARNNGLRNSSGEYILFVDSDDWLQPFALQTFIDLQNKYDYDLIICASCINEFYKRKSLKYVEHVDSFLSNDKSKVRKKLFDLYIKGIIHGPCGKLYKRKIIQKYNLAFPNYRRSQDIFFNINYFQNLTSLLVVDKIVYNIRNIFRVNTDKNYRRNATFMINAEKERLNTIIELDNLFLSTLNKWGYICSYSELNNIRRKFVIDLHDAIYAIFLRSSKNAISYMKEISDENYIKEKLSSSCKCGFYYSLFIKLFKKKRFRCVVNLMKIKRTFYPLYKFLRKKNGKN